MTDLGGPVHHGVLVVEEEMKRSFPVPEEIHSTVGTVEPSQRPGVRELPVFVVDEFLECLNRPVEINGVQKPMTVKEGVLCSGDFSEVGTLDTPVMGP